MKNLLMPMFFNFFKMKPKRTYTLLIYLHPASRLDPEPEIVKLQDVPLPSDLLAHFTAQYGKRLIGVLVMNE